MNSVASLTPPLRRAVAADSPQRRAGAADVPVTVLIIDADPVERRNLAGIIAARGDGKFVASAFASTREAEEALADLADSIVLADLDTLGGTEALNGVSAQRPTIATSINPSLSVAVAAMRGGAADFLPKPIGARALIEHLTEMLANHRRGENRRPQTATLADRHDDGEDADFEGFIGRSPAMLAVYAGIRRIAASRAPVFVTGESGSGKELAAAAVHAGFSRAAGHALPFVALNCSAIPKDLMESEIFGHVRGAFTGASEARAGAAQLADAGILFLDEIAEMDLGLQAKLLRFVQTGQYRRVGAEEPESVEVRIVSATNRDPLAEVAAGRLRADLFHRLYVLPLEMPPLRQRGDDILLLAEKFLRRFATEEGRAFRGFTGEAAAALMRHAWPGNVRELANCVRRAVVLGDGPLVTPEALIMTTVPEGEAAPRPASMPLETPVAPYWQQERAIIERAVSASGGNIARAAAALGISPATVYRKRNGWRTSPVA